MKNFAVFLAEKKNKIRSQTWYWMILDIGMLICHPISSNIILFSWYVCKIFQGLFDMILDERCCHSTGSNLPTRPVKFLRAVASELCGEPWRSVGPSASETCMYNMYTIVYHIYIYIFTYIYIYSSKMFQQNMDPKCERCVNICEPTAPTSRKRKSRYVSFFSWNAMFLNSWMLLRSFRKASKHGESRPQESELVSWQWHKLATPWGLDTPGFFDGTEGLTAATSAGPVFMVLKAGLDGECIENVVMPITPISFCQHILRD